MPPWMGMRKKWIPYAGISLSLIMQAGLGTFSPSLSGNLFAQEPNPAPSATAPASEPVLAASESADGIWSLEALQSLALQNNPTLVQAAASTDMARGLQRQAGLYPNPQLGYLRNDSSQATGPRTKGVFIGQEIVTTGKRKKAVAAESWEIEQRNWNYQAQMLRVQNDVQLRYWDVLAAQEIRRILERLKSLSERGLTLAERQFKAGIVSRADILQARIQLRTVELLQRDTMARYVAAWQQLKTVTGCPDLESAELQDTLPDTFSDLEWDSCYRRILSESPLLQAAKARSQHFQGQYTLEVANRVPNVNLQVVADRDSNDKASSVSTLISMPIPVSNRNQGNIYRAAAETREAAAEISRTELALRDQLAESFRRFQTAKVTAEQLGKEIIPDAEETVKLSIDSYQAKEVGFLSVLTAQRTLIETKISYIESRVEAARAQTEIEGLLLTGALNPAELGTALQAQPGSSSRRAILNQMEGNSSKGLLPAAIQSGGP